MNRVTLAGYPFRRQNNFARSVPGHQAIFGLGPVPGPDWQFVDSRARPLRRRNRGPADGLMVTMAIFAPRGEHHVTRLQVAFDEGRQLRFP
ncbi:hypothetical protein D3C73_1035200 [compost metagenome]